MQAPILAQPSFLAQLPISLQQAGPDLAQPPVLAQLPGPEQRPRLPASQDTGLM